MSNAEICLSIECQSDEITWWNVYFTWTAPVTRKWRNYSYRKKDHRVVILVCKKFICLNGMTCMMENGVQVCRCLFNCSSEINQVRILKGKLFEKKFSIRRYVHQMESCIEIYANWNVINAYGENIFNQWIIHIVARQWSVRMVDVNNNNRMENFNVNANNVQRNRRNKNLFVAVMELHIGEWWHRVHVFF